ncbi:MAG: phosphorylase [Cyanobacteria bacterium Co-bin13]|nr:phosphorylase [Cyanobacteria bacterium Co-bin13]
MDSPVLLFEPGTLLPRVRQVTEQALACRALQPIETEFDFLHQGNLRFLVRKLANVARKERAKIAQDAKSQARGKEINPFLPYDSELFVSDLTPTHLCLLNKYNVVDNHILIVTRAFVEQDSWLTAQDFEALWACMAEIDGLGFYNGGSLAGASQRHKHLQLVPLPMAPDSSALPLDALIQAADLENRVGTLADLPFAHAVMGLSADWLAASAAGDYLLTCYQQLMAAIGLNLQALLPDQPYNLLITRLWMLAVPRRQDSYQSIPVNSLGFAGSLLVKNEEQLRLLREIGPLTLLTHVAYPR